MSAPSVFGKPWVVYGRVVWAVARSGWFWVPFVALLAIHAGMALALPVIALLLGVGIALLFNLCSLVGLIARTFLDGIAGGWQSKAIPQPVPVAVTPKEPTQRDQFAEAQRRYLANCQIILESDLDAVQKQAALREEKRVLEERVGKLME